MRIKINLTAEVKDDGTVTLRAGNRTFGFPRDMADTPEAAVMLMHELPAWLVAAWRDEVDEATARVREALRKNQA